MSNLDLTDVEHAALLRLVKKALDTDSYPMSPQALSAAGDPGEVGAAPGKGTAARSQGLRIHAGNRRPHLPVN